MASQDLENQKRKREADDGGSQPVLHAPPAPPLQQQGNANFNYLLRSNAERLALIQGDADTFSHIIGLIGDYEGVMERHESLAASLGAQLTGPRLLKGFEKFFEGPIKTKPPQPLSWLEVCTFAKTNPGEFILTTLPDGTRCCQFALKGLQCEISEDDWRFISSGVLNRIPLEHPLEEDETAELATLDIVEQRAAVLYKKADEVAKRARILHHKLGQRKQEISRRRRMQEDSSGSGSGSWFQSANQSGRTPSHGYDLHADLLHQFLVAPATPTGTLPPPSSGAGLSQGQASPSLGATQTQRLSGSRRSSGAAVDPDAPPDTFRPLITQKIDKLGRGEPIRPPCDRCRRLKLHCAKHLTACQGCTKKHAKCSWKAVTEQEASRLKREMGVGGGGGEAADTETETPEPRPAEMTLAAIMSAEESRPTSRGGDVSGPAAFGVHGFLSSGSSSGGRQDYFPPMRVRSNLTQGQGGGGGGRGAETPQSQSSMSQFGGERQGWPHSNPPSR